MLISLQKSQEFPGTIFSQQWSLRGVCNFHFNRLWVLFIAFCALFGAAEAQAPLNIRIALVVGNSAYARSPLPNPTNDARAISETLRGLGFHVIEVRDGTKEQMTSSIEAVKHALIGKQGIGMFYYAGHAIQFDWSNYMVPVNANLESPQDLANQTVSLNSVLAAFTAAKTRMNIVVLDACRDNPFQLRSSLKGLAPMDAPSGTILAYATAPGNVAIDGLDKSGHGLYTQHLLEELRKTPAKIEDIFKRVRTNVRERSKGQQIPWESTSLEDDFYFDGSPAAGNKRFDPASADILAQRQQAFEQEKTSWDRIKETDKVDELFAYLKMHPSGYMTEQAQFRLDLLQKTHLENQAKKDEPLPLKSGVQRFLLGDEWSYERVDHIEYKTTIIRNKVTFVDDKTAVINNGNLIFDHMGALLKNPGGVNDPGLMRIPSDIEVGKKWQSAFTRIAKEGRRTGASVFNGRVVGREIIELKAGRFATVKIEISGVNVFPDGTRTEHLTLWVDPTTMFPVKQYIESYFGGRRIRSATSSVISLNLKPRLVR